MAVDRSREDAPAVEIPNARRPAPGLLTGGQPTPDHLKEAAEAGYRTVVCLRMPTEEGAWDASTLVRTLDGVRYVHLPVTGPLDVTAENAAMLDRILGEADALPALIYCKNGNRVGALLAARASLFQGASVEQALELGRQAGLVGLEPATREFIQRQTAGRPRHGQADPD